MKGYGRTPPNPEWPGGARVAVSFVINFEEGAEMSLSAGADGIVRLVEGHDGEEVAALTGHTEEVYSVAFSPDGEWAVSGGADSVALIGGLLVEGRTVREVARDFLEVLG